MAGDTGNGFLVVVAIAVVLVAFIVLRLAKTVNGWVFGIIAFITISLIFLAPSMFGGVEALVSIKAFQSFLLKAVGAVTTIVIVVAAINRNYSVSLLTHNTNVRAQGEHGMFDGSHTSGGIAIGPGATNTQKTEVESLYRAAENITAGRPNLIESASQSLLGGGIRHTVTKHPNFFARILFGEKPQEHEVVDGKIVK